MMKLKKSDGNSKRHLSSQGHSLLSEAHEDARGLLTGEMVPEAIEAADHQNHNKSKSKSQKRNNWRSALGFGGGGGKSSNNKKTNSNSNSSGNGDDKKKKQADSNHKKKEKKQREKKQKTGYMKSLTPKGNAAGTTTSSSSMPPISREESTTHFSTTSMPTQLLLPTPTAAAAATVTTARIKLKPEVEGIRSPNLPAAVPVVAVAALVVATPPPKAVEQDKVKQPAALKTSTASPPEFEVAYEPPPTTTPIAHETEVARMIAPNLSNLTSTTTTSINNIRGAAAVAARSPTQSRQPLPSKSMTNKKVKSPAKSLTKKTAKSPTKPQQKMRASPVARAAALALVRGKNEDDDDFGEHDFDPNEDNDDEDYDDDDDDDDEEDSSLLDMDLDDDEMDDETSTPGPIISGSDSSAFSFNLAANSFKNGSSRKENNNKMGNNDGFEILSKRSSKMRTMSTTHAHMTLPTVCSTQSSMSSPSSQQQVSSPASSSSPKLTASASMLSQQSTNSSSLFSLKSSLSKASTAIVSPSSSKGRGGTPTTPLSTKSQKKKSTSSSPSPLSPVSAKKQQSKLKLSRPFGRQSLPQSAMPWLVEVAPAEWDHPERSWKYRIQVTHSVPARKQPPTPSSNVAITWRSLDNFVWLEHALNTEYQGGLVLPLLNIAVGMTDLEQVTHEIDPMLLRDWLNDVLNGVRGQGELLLPGQQHHKRSVDLLRSEAVEAFLYRNTAPLEKPSNLIYSLMGEALLRKHQDLQDAQRRQHRLQQRRHDEDDEDRNCRSAMCRPTPSGCSPSASSQVPLEEDEQSFVASLIQGPLALITEELCVGMGCQIVEESPSSVGSFVSGDRRFEQYSSRHLGSANTLDIQDSFLDGSTITSMQQTPLSATSLLSPLAHQANKSTGRWKQAQSYDLILGERDLALSYRKTALSTMEKVQVLMEEEEHIGLAWKRFGIAVSNLFSYEKEVENARLGDKKIHRDHMPYGTVKKSTVDQCIRTLAQHKVDRSVNSLRVLNPLLTAYVADLSAVAPSVDAYREGVAQMASVEDVFSTLLSTGKRKEKGEEKSDKDGSVSTPSMASQTPADGSTTNGKFGEWQEHLLDLARTSSGSNTNAKLGEWQDQLLDLARTSSQKLKSAKFFASDLIQTNSTSSTDNTDEIEQPALATELQQLRVVGDRVLSNEILLKESLTTLCKSISMRTARMAYTYFKSEAAQCAMLKADAGNLRSKIDLSNKETVAKMIARHQEENKEDMKTELALAQRMVNLGNMKKFSPPGSSASNMEETIEVDTDNQDDNFAKAEMRDNALQIARERVGHWNSDLAMAIMKAVGVDDPNVRVEETTRELRLVRKFAIGLREHLNRCIEAVDALRNAVLKGRAHGRVEGVDTGKKPTGPIGQSRQECYGDLFTLFSGVYIPQEGGSPRNAKISQSAVTLAKAGIQLNDPLGWSASTSTASAGTRSSPKHTMQNDGTMKCGTAAQSYVKLRDSQTEWLLSSISGLLNDYTQRVEVVESFVYMECVGAQLEKHFSKRRSDALAVFEKKTDITSAINIATRKRIPGLVDELKAKLEKFGADVTHTSVKESKEAHLESKSVKTELHDLALRRLLRARETSTERVIDLLKFWMKEEESACISELNALAETIECLENSSLTAE